MSAAQDTEAGSSPEVSPRKRKAEYDAAGRSKIKKRKKHEKVDADINLPKAVEKKERKSKKDKKSKRKISEEKHDIESNQISTEIGSVEGNDNDVIMQDLPTSQTVTADVAHAQNGLSYQEGEEQKEEHDTDLLHSDELTCFYQKRLSLQLPIPAIALSSTASSLLSLYLAPLLLTYYPPAEGIILSFSDPILTATPNFGVNLPLKPPNDGDISRHAATETPARCADENGVCWVWLTVTALVFQPKTGDALQGFANVTSEGFIGLVSYNYFQAAVGRTRIPKEWIWDGPLHQSRNGKKKSKKGRLKDLDGADVQEEIADSSQLQDSQDDVVDHVVSGNFTDMNGDRIGAMQKYHVVDIEMVPAPEKDRWTLQIEGSLLSSAAEEAALAEERQRFEQVRSGQRRSRSLTPAVDSESPLISGDILAGHEHEIPS